MEECSPSIEIVNYDNYEIVSYSLVLIKGKICGYSISSDFIEITCSCNGCSDNWPIVENNFRSLTLLKKGINELQFSYKNTRKIIFLEFKKRISEFCVFPLYIVFENGENNLDTTNNNSSSATCSRISFCAKLLQSFYAEKLYENGFGHKTFQLIGDILDNYKDDGCHVFQSKLTKDYARSLSPECLWETLGREIMKSEIGNARYKYMAVTSIYSANTNLNSVQVALGSGGLALIDSLPVFSWPCSVSQVLSCFTDLTRLSAPLCFNKWYRGTVGGCCSSSIGSLCHELGHTFDLGHPKSGIMSTDFHLFHNAFLPVASDKQVQVTTFDLHFIPNITSTVSQTLNEIKVSNTRNTSRQNGRQKKIIDDSSFTPGCLSILSNHKWFNNIDKYFKMYFDRDRVILQSDIGLKVVQLRGENGKVLKSWELNGLRTEHMVLPRINTCSMVFAMDNYGNISKFSYND